MAEPAALEVEFHGREFSEFDLIRIVRAAGQGFSEPVTAYLVSAQIVSGCAVGVVYGLDDVGQFGCYRDGNFFKTSEIRSLRKEGKFWVATTESARYVLVSFQKGWGREGLRRFLELANRHVPSSPESV